MMSPNGCAACVRRLGAPAPQCMAILARAAGHVLHTGWLHLERKEFKEAEETLMALSNDPATKNDPYAWLALAALNFQSAQAALADRRKVRPCKHPACYPHAAASSLTCKETHPAHGIAACGGFSQRGAHWAATDWPKLQLWVLPACRTSQRRMQRKRRSSWAAR